MKYSELLRLLKKDGWSIVRQSGSHVMMNHPLKEGQIVVPNHGSKEVKKGIQIDILKKAGIIK